MTGRSGTATLSRVRARVYEKLHNLSLTARLVSVVILLTLAAFVATTTLTAYLLRDYLTDRIDTDLDTYIQPLATMAFDTLRAQPSELNEELLPPNTYYVLVSDRRTDATVDLWIPRDLGASPPEIGPIAWDDPRLTLSSSPEAFTVSSVDGETDYRVLAKRLNNGEGTLAVAVSLTPVQNTVRQLVLLSGVVGFSTLVAVGLLGWYAVRRAFRPLGRIEDTAAAIAAGDLTSRIPPREANDEVASLSQSLNTMLARIEHSFAVRQASEQQMRQFVADASHELRTPLATVRGYAELYRVGGVTEPDDVTGAMRRIEDEATRMSRLVDDMLLLTRLDTQPEIQPRPVDLTVLAADTVQDARVRAPQREIQLVPLQPPGQRTDADAGASVMTSGDDHALRQVLANLVGNALSHTPSETPIEVAAGSAGGRAVLEVRDHGTGIPPDVADRVFERFYRADASRSRAQGGTGLGLAIVAAIVGKHRGRVRHLPTPGGGATFRIELPLVRP